MYVVILSNPRQSVAYHFHIRIDALCQVFCSFFMNKRVIGRFDKRKYQIVWFLWIPPSVDNLLRFRRYDVAVFQSHKVGSIDAVA